MAEPQTTTPSSPSAGLKLSAPVGPKQKNSAGDVLMIQKLLNTMVANQLLVPLAPLQESGVFDERTEHALQFVQLKYFYGMADGHGVLEPGDSLFEFLTDVADNAGCKKFSPRLSSDMYGLAAVMVPGGADKRTKHGAVDGSVRKYLPEILLALKQRDMADETMLLMALSTIRAETSGFKPIDEGLSKYNTSAKGTPNRHAFDLYDKKNGNLGAPDGSDFKGRGFIQLTGRENYAKIGKEIGLGDQLVKNPDLADDPTIAANILARFLKNHEESIRAAVSKGDLPKARKLVNGGSHGLADFTAAFNAGRKYLNEPLIQTVKHKVHTTKKTAPANHA